MNEIKTFKDELIQRLEEKFKNSKRPIKAHIAFKKFKTWNAFWNKVISIDPSNPNIQALVFSVKIIILCGILESLLRKKDAESSKELFEQAMNFLDDEEKFLFCQQVFVLNKFNLNISDVNKRILNFYLREETNNFQQEFKRIVNYFYGLRSELVHQGGWGITITYGPIFLFLLGKGKKKKGGKRRELKLNERYISLEEIFLRILAKYSKIDIDDLSLKNKVKKFILEQGYATKNKKHFELFKKKFDLT
ncbi:MAG: hypothetical protein QXG91_04030 [Candidatus Aenigmatarchaeota archaeon]